VHTRPCLEEPAVGWQQVVKAVEMSTTLYKYFTGFYLFIIGLVSAMPCNGPIFK